MKLTEALRIINRPLEPAANTAKVFLAVGFTPLHLETLLKAHLMERAREEKINISLGNFDDLWGNLERARESSDEVVATVIEWADLDPRLGLRRLGGWAPGNLTDIISSVRKRAAGLTKLLEEVSQRKVLALSLPSLPLPPVGYTRPVHAGYFELQLKDSISQIALALAGSSNCRIINSQELDIRSPLVSRIDVNSELGAGFPYSITHSSVLAELLAGLIKPPQPKKGLITDLDDTLWDGILGEIGTSGISWSLENNTQIHGLYQQLVAALADAGVLVAIASKNDPTLVDRAFEREDLILTSEKIFPFEVNWGRKSESVGRILAKWNISADAVVFVDDSPMEVAEVSATHKGIECLQFPKGDDQAVYTLLKNLRDLFGKYVISEEDTLRRESLRKREELSAAIDSSVSMDAFLESLEAELNFDWENGSADPRALELINKTNQFNLNGLRIDQGNWLEMLGDKAGILLILSYRDKFGALGKISVLYGRLGVDHFSVDTWVMSCRAFSRRIEYACLHQLFDKFDVEKVSFNYIETERNGPVAELFQELVGEAPVTGNLSLSRSDFELRCPPLNHFSTKDITIG